MRSLFAACLTRLGLSYREAAALHCVDEDVVLKWVAGEEEVPQGVWDELRDMEAEIKASAAVFYELWEMAGRSAVEIDTQVVDSVSVLGLADVILGQSQGVPVAVSLKIGEGFAGALRRLN